MRATPSKIFWLVFVCALVAPDSACSRGASENARQSNSVAQTQAAQSNSNGAGAPASPADIPKLNSDIERLEKAAERNPGDDDTRDELARVYVRRGDAERVAGQVQEALNDYQRALRLDPNNDDASKNAADLQAQTSGEQEDENGAPAPLPITPNVTDDEEKPAATPGEKPTPKKQ